MIVDVERKDHSIKKGIIFGGRIPAYDAYVTIEANDVELQTLEKWVRDTGSKEALLFSYDDPDPDFQESMGKIKYRFGEIIKEMRSKGKSTINIFSRSPSTRDELLEELLDQIRSWKDQAMEGPVHDRTTMEI